MLIPEISREPDILDTGHRFTLVIGMSFILSHAGYRSFEFIHLLVSGYAIYCRLLACLGTHRYNHAFCTILFTIFFHQLHPLLAGIKSHRPHLSASLRKPYLARASQPYFTSRTATYLILPTWKILEFRFNYSYTIMRRNIKEVYKAYIKNLRALNNFIKASCMYLRCIIHRKITYNIRHIGP